MDNQTKSFAASLEPVFEGFRRISPAEQIDYLKYLALVIENNRNHIEKRLLIRFKAKLESEIETGVKPL